MMLGNIGAFIGAAGRLPYDAEVEYLESTGTQWIDTGVKPDSSYLFDTSVAAVDSLFNTVYWGCRSSGTYKTENSQCYLNSNTATGTGSYRRIRLISTNADLMSNWDSGIIPVAGQMHSLIGCKSVSTMYAMTYNITLFAFNAMGTINSAAGRCRIGGWRTYSNGETVSDLIPVRFTNENGQSEGAMYDRANPTVGMNPDGSARTDGLYRNRGTGAFLYGADKN